MNVEVAVPRGRFRHDSKVKQVFISGYTARNEHHLSFFVTPKPPTRHSNSHAGKFFMFFSRKKRT